MIKFKTGCCYSTRSVGDYDCVIQLTVASRTKCFIKTTDGKRLRVNVWNDVETVKPWGSYSMAPVVGADRLATDAQA